MNRITPQQALHIQQTGGIIIDVCTPAEFNEEHIVNAFNKPLDKITMLMGTIRILTQGKKVVLTCRKGTRAALAYKQLQQLDAEITIVEEGNYGWNNARLPMYRNEHTPMSIERQVRIAAGGIGLAGSLLAVFVSSNFIFIPIFIGAGLVNAGITNWCGMGKLLMKMPWNKA
ncbi:MAG TPA: DUF2892 domain-containing protein [Aeromonadales bacterium]|nr:DUF2892 domain-containing protein [Aeromonadales bacterium]